VPTTPTFGHRHIAWPSAYDDSPIVTVRVSLKIVLKFNEISFQKKIYCLWEARENQNIDRRSMGSSPAAVEVIFLKPPSRSTPSPSFRRVPCPSPAAAPAGGWGSIVSRVCTT
jgi:hypothetical protein